jgi:hypothetical protein
MSARIGFSLATLRHMDPAACDTDARLVWRDGDSFNVGIVQPRYPRESWDQYFIQQLSLSSTREMRLLGKQLIAHADELERDSNQFEVVIA